MRTFAILCFVFSFTGFCAQNLQISRYYAGNAKNVPVHIYNHNASFFYVLRYNKSIHDFIIERRTKPGAELSQIYPLRLDSVNSKWFDYEKLDYLLFENGGQLYFVFVKELNNQSTVYFKCIDAAGKITGFNAVCTATADLTKASVRMEIEKDKNNNLLITQRYRYSNQTAKTTVMCYDLQQKKFLTQLQLPIENNYTGYSTAYTMAGDSNLYYLQVFSRVASFSGQYTTQGVAMVPLFITDSLFLVKVSTNAAIQRSKVPFTNLYHQFNVHILAAENTVALVFRTAVESDSGLVHKFFTCKYRAVNLRLLSYSEMPLDAGISKKLEYYDGSDNAKAGAKSFEGLNSFWQGSTFNVLEGRREQNYFKELLYWNFDTTGSVKVNQYLIPRKIFFFPNRTVYHKQAEVATVSEKNVYHLFVLEHRGNKTQRPQEYKHRSFIKQSQLRTGVLTQYKVTGAGISKRTVFENNDFDWVPMVYDGWDKDFVFYLTKHKAEKWAILTDPAF